MQQTNYKTIPLSTIIKKPNDLKGYIKIHNQYWPVDKNNNVFFVDSRAIYGNTRQTVRFYIERLKLPVGSYKPIKLKEVWVKREYGESEVRRRIGRK